MMPIKTKPETRSFPATYETRAADDGGMPGLSGQPIVYNQPADIGGWFQEIVDPGALDSADLTDVLLFTNHDDRKIPLARSRNNNGNSTMTLTINQNGLGAEASLDTQRNADASSVYSAVDRGDMSGMSIAWIVGEDSWENLDSDYPIRHVRSIAKIFEVSVVNNPAYEATWVQTRDTSALDSARLVLDSARAEARSLDSDTAAEIRSKEIELARARALAH